MKESYKSLISTSTKFDISQKKFGDRSSTLSNLSNIGFPIIEGFFISYDIMKQIEIGQQTPQIPCKFLECGPFCLRSSTNNTEIAGLEPFLYLGLNKEKIDELSNMLGKKIGGFNGDACGASIVLVETTMFFMHSVLL